MKLILWIGVEVTDKGGVRVCDGSWNLLKELGEGWPDGDAVQEVAKRFVAHCDKLNATPPLREECGRKPGHPANGKPAESAPRPQLEPDLVAMGWSEQEAKLLVTMHGATRISDLVAWVKRKKEPVSSPKSLIESCLRRQ